MSISEPFIRRPVATWLIAVAILLAGVLAYFKLPVSPLPRVDFPTISVSASLPGAGPETMASSVATPLERRFGRIAGVTEITSNSSLGSTSITLQFDLDRNVEDAARDVQAAINAASSELPSNLPSRPTFRKVNPADAPTLIIALKSDVLPLSEVYDIANSNIAQRVAQVEGVGQVSVGGGQQPAVRIEVDPEAMAGSGITSAAVRNSVGLASIASPKGDVSDGKQAAVISANDQLWGAEQYKQLIVSQQNGSVVRVTDVASVRDGVENERVAGWLDGHRAVMLIIRRQPGANILEMNERVKALIPELAKDIPPSIQMEVALDRTGTIRASVNEVQFTLLLSIGLVVFVVFLFLRSGRATAIPSVAVPLSLLATFGVMYLFDYSLDNLSLMALTISTGFVVDDAIVVTENVTRYIELGYSPLDAALKGAKEVGFTIISITLSLLAVFIPILAMGGIVGRLFREFAVTLSIAIGVSALISLTITPMMCASWLKSDHGVKHGRAYRGMEWAFDSLQAGYGYLLRIVLRWRRVTMAVTLVVIGLTVFLYTVVPSSFFPQQDTGQILGTTEGSQDVSFPAMKAHQEEVNAILREDPDINHTISSIGSFNGSGNSGTVFIGLKEDRKASADEIINRLRGKLGKLTGINLFMQSVQDVRIGGRGSKTQYQYTLQDSNLQELREWAPKLLDTLSKLPELKDVTTDQQTAAIQLDFNLDRDTLARLGLGPGDVDGALYDAFGQRQIATNYSEKGQYHVVMVEKPELVAGPDTLDALYVQSPGGIVPLRMLGKRSISAAPLSINHQGQFPATTISFNLAPGVALGQAVDAINEAQAKIGLPAGVQAGFAGTAQAFKSSLSSEPLLIGLAIFAVYVILGMLYESWIHPITILSTIPSAGLGALLALLIFHVDLSIIAIIGILLLVGIVKKNAIMMVDFAIEVERKEGLTHEQAIEKACLLRFRPILMTTMAALLGSLPLAIDRATGAELRQPLGIAIVGGLIVSQILTLFTTPVTYLALSGKKKYDALPPPSGDGAAHGGAAHVPAHGH